MPKTNPTAPNVGAIERARGFLFTHARLLERRRFAFLFERGPADAVLRALAAYENPDGGFGHALEPDLRGPESEPIPAWTALGILDEVRAPPGARWSRIVRYLERIEADDGGIPFVFPAARRSPHAPWWERAPGRAPGALNPTAGIVAYLQHNRIRSAWGARAADWCWERLGAMRAVDPYELRVVLAFLDHTPDRQRAEEHLVRLRPLVRTPGVVDLDPRRSRAGFRPLDYSPDPGLRSRTLFTEAEIAAHLDLIARTQRSDGGWGVEFPIWTPITRFDWEGCQTLEMLKRLKTHGRLRSRRR